jgi:midasin
MREIYQNFEEILSAQENDQQPFSSSEMQQQQAAEQLEYIRPDETAAEDDMQALGPSGEEQATKLENLKILDEEEDKDKVAAAPDDNIEMSMDIDDAIPNEAEKREEVPLEADLQARALQEDIAGAVTDAEVRAQKMKQTDGTMDVDEDSPAIVAKVESPVDVSDEPEPEPEDAVVEREVRQWQAQGHPAEGAEHIWRLYESLTHDLAYALCEQLRLILEPTQATRLRGDYRTGKRLNMKKIIPYIASDYTKDKIWLRRTRPSAREYQVLLAIDDSRSMAESRSVHLAYETLALVAKALSRLEVGDVAIAKFGQAVEILHGFDAGTFSDQAGAKVMGAFGFDQKATNVLALVDRSLAVLEAARNRRAMMGSSAAAAELWQLEIIISDGICQDHERLRNVLRKAKEQRVMIVFVIIDSLHSAADATKRGKAENSILTMNQVTWKNVNGTMDMQLERYLDSFPFEYYVVLRSVEALPDVLSSTLKQFFERVSGE